MNSNPIVFAPDTRLEVRYSTHSLADKLRPFVLDLSDRLMRGGSLADSVAATASSMPELATYFVIDRDAEESFSLREEYLFIDWNVHSLEFIRLRDRERYSIDVADRCPARDR